MGDRGQEPSGINEATPATLYDVVINGVSHTFLSGGAPTPSTISAGLAASIVAGSEPTQELVETEWKLRTMLEAVTVC